MWSGYTNHKDCVVRIVLPDGIFANQKYQFWYNLEGLRIDTFGIFHNLLLFLGHLLYFIDIWYLYHVVIWYFFAVLAKYWEKIWQSCIQQNL
jgi:hypothetical protein